jgi:two-component system sensor histidine kinase AtoS
MPGEFGRIADGINNMADSVQRSIRERELLEEKIRKAQKLAALGRVVAGVAHEVRNPLTTIGGYVQYWADNPSTVPSRDSLNLVNSETKRLNSLVERLLIYAKSTDGNMTSIDIHDVLSYARDLCNADSTSKEVAIEIISGESIPTIQGDPHLLVQIFINLFSNAIAASGKGQKVTCKTLCITGPNRVRVEVTDEGCGIAEEHTDLVFEPFFTTKDRGTGLGLAISREIVIAHGGDISFNSVLGSGTTFWVDLPVVEA